MLATLILAASVAAAKPVVVHRSANFTVEASNLPLAKRVAHDAEKARRLAASYWLGRELDDWPDRVPIFVRSDLPIGEMKNGYQKDLGRQFVYIELLGHDEAEVDEVVAHEVVHAVLRREVEVPAGHDLPRWMHEGAAVCFEVDHGRYPYFYGDTITQVRLKTFVELKDAPFFISGGCFYATSGAIAMHVRRTYGAAAFWDWWRDAGVVGWDAATERVLGLSVEELERDLTYAMREMSCPFPRSLRGVE